MVGLLLVFNTNSRTRKARKLRESRKKEGKKEVEKSQNKKSSFWKRALKDIFNPVFALDIFRGFRVTFAPFAFKIWYSLVVSSVST